MKVYEYEGKNLNELKEQKINKRKSVYRIECE